MAHHPTGQDNAESGLEDGITEIYIRVEVPEEEKLGPIAWREFQLWNLSPCGWGRGLRGSALGKALGKLGRGFRTKGHRER